MCIKFCIGRHTNCRKTLVSPEIRAATVGNRHTARDGESWEIEDEEEEERKRLAHRPFI